MIRNRGDATLKTKQFNLRMAVDVIDWVNQQAQEDNRTPGIWLSLFLQKHSGKAKKNPVSTSVKVVSSWIVPEGINSKAWQEFDEHRKKHKSPWTDLAKTKSANILLKLTYEEQQETVDKSTQAGWPGLYPEKGNETNKRSTEPSSEADKVRAACAAKRNSRSEREINGETVGEDGQPVRVQVYQAVRADSRRDLDVVHEGDFWSSDGVRPPTMR